MKGHDLPVIEPYAVKGLRDAGADDVNEYADEMARQLEHIRDRLRSYPEGHLGLQVCAMFRVSDLIRLGRFDDLKRIAHFEETPR